MANQQAAEVLPTMPRKQHWQAAKQACRLDMQAVRWAVEEDSVAAPTCCLRDFHVLLICQHGQRMGGQLDVCTRISCHPAQQRGMRL